MDSNLQGKITVVTGATRGIGKGIAIALGEAGATVYITGRTLNSGDLDDVTIGGTLTETKQEVEKAGGVCIAVQVDHNDDEQVRLLFERIKSEQNGQLDLLVNNVFSGVKTLADAYGNPFWKQEPNLWDAINNVGLRSHYVASIYAARLMSQRQQGLICTISSWGGLSYLFGTAYGVGKTACDRLAADMAVELKSYNIASLSIWPGIVETENMSNFFEEMNTLESSNSPTISDGYNWETPLLTGRVIAALAQEPNLMKKNGKVQIVAELAQKYKIVDENESLCASLRSLRFILPLAMPFLKQYNWLIPDIKVPWWILTLTMLQSPKI